MKSSPLIVLLALTFFFGAGASEKQRSKSFYDFGVKDIDGMNVDLSKYKGKVLLVVNVASKCGYTRQYRNLVNLKNKFREAKFEILAFPANNYGKQEPWAEGKIKTFCQEKFSVNFPMFSKVSTKGEDQHPLFGHLTRQPNPDIKGDIKWNFEKFLISKKGELLHRYRSKDVPDGKKIMGAITAALKG